MSYRPRSAETVRLRSTRDLEAAMRARNLSGADVARAVQVSRQYVSLLRKGDRRTVARPVALRLERLLDVTLFDREDEEASA